MMEITWPKKIVWNNDKSPILKCRKTIQVLTFDRLLKRLISLKTVTYLPILCILLFFCNSTFAATYIYTGSNPDYPTNVERRLPKSWRFLDGTSTGNFDLETAFGSRWNAEGWLKVTANNSPSYDPDIQNAGAWAYTTFADHAEKTRTVIDKNLAPVQKAIKKRLKAQGIAIIKARWNIEEKYLGLLTAQEVTDMDADITTIKAYFSTLKTDVNNAGNVQAAKAVLTGATWPTL